MKDEDIKNIDVWLASLSKESIVKILTIVKILQSTSELIENPFFTVPYEAFQKVGLDDTSMEAILIKLWKKGIINLLDCNDKPNYTSNWNKEFDPDNSFNDKTGIKLNLDAFKYLRRALVNNKERFFMVPEGYNFIYENGVLMIRTYSKYPSVLDLSKANLLRPVFESFFYLYNNGAKKLFTPTELLNKHKEITKQIIEWKLFIKRKSSIKGKMINKKEDLKNRIVWEYNRELHKHKFEILPLSDE